MGRRARVRDALAVREFRVLWVAELLSIVGDQLARVALAVLVYERTSSAGWTALTYALTYLPALLGGAFLSGLADRYPRREVMVAADLGRAVIAGAMALPVLPLPVVIGLVFVLTLAGGPFKAAQQALLPAVLPGDTYVAGLALRTVTNQAAQVAGFLGGGILLAVLNPHMALGLNAGTFLIAAGLVAGGVRHRRAVRSAVGADSRGGTAAAVRLIWRDRYLRRLLAVSWLVGLFVVPEGLAAPYAAGLGAATIAVGLLMAADPVGSVMGAWLVTRIPEHARSRLIIPLAVASGLPLAACVVYPGLATSVALWAVSGACSTVYLILAQASFTRRVPDHQRGAATGLASTGLLTSQGLAILCGGLVADVTNPALAIAGAGAAGAILVGLVGASWRESRSRRDQSDDGEKRDDAMTDPMITSPYQSSPAPPPAGPAAEHGNGSAGSIIVARHPRRASRSESGQPSRLPWRWPLWQVPRRALVFIIAVEAFGIALMVIVGPGGSITPLALGRFAVIVGLALAVGEMTRRVERARRRFNDTPHVNLTSVWVVPAALLLPLTLAAAVVVVVYLHLFWRSWYRVRGVHAYRLVFSATTMVLAACLTWMITQRVMLADVPRWTELATIATVVVSLLAFSAVNSGLVGAAICLFEGRVELRRAWGTGRENALEYGTLGLGAITALLITVHPAWPLVMVPALLVLHRSVLLRQLEEAAATDPKTGLTNAAAWNTTATKELQRAADRNATLGVLWVDIDHFKNFNDTYGHLVGDQVLQAIADALSKAIRRDDLVGRWGGEEFVILCPDVSAAELEQIGKRICERVRRLEITKRGQTVAGLTVSIGAACYPEFGPELQDVLLAADNALFAAKDKGRNQVVRSSATAHGVDRRGGSAERPFSIGSSAGFDR